MISRRLLAAVSVIVAVIVSVSVAVGGPAVAAPSVGAAAGQGANTAHPPTLAAAHHSWSGPDRPFPFPRGGPISVSCVSTTFCQAIDTWGFVFTYNGSTWTKTGHLGRHRDGAFAYIVCLSRKFCLGSVQTTEVYRFDGTSWSALARIAGGTTRDGDSVLSLACASTSFCVAGMEDGLAATYNGHHWSRAKQIDPDTPPTDDGPWLVSASCSSARFCVVGDDSGQVLRFDGRSWSKPTSITASANSVTGVSCLSATYCLAATGVSISRYNGTRWTTVRHRPAHFAPASVNCKSKSFCLVLDAKHYSSSVYNGHSFTATRSIQTTQPDQPGLTPPGVGSCVSARFCVALVEDGASVNRGKAWTHPHRFDPLGGGLSEITCTAGPFCLAADSTGNTKTYRSGHWKKAGSTGSEVYSLSCVAPTFCAAITSAGAQVFNGSSWSRAQLGDEDLEYVSCSSRTFCLAADGAGDFASYNGSTWADAPLPPIDDDNESVNGISCVAPATCVAVIPLSSSTVSDVFDGTSWAEPVTISRGRVEGPSCAGTTCIAGSDKSVYSYNGSRWSRPTNLGMEVRGGSCGSPTFCVAFGDSKVSFFDGTTWSTPSRVNAKATSLQEVSCASAHFCLVDNHDRDAYTGR